MMTSYLAYQVTLVPKDPGERADYFTASFDGVLDALDGAFRFTWPFASSTLPSRSSFLSPATLPDGLA